jgi:hypothetical protein
LLEIGVKLAKREGKSMETEKLQQRINELLLEIDRLNTELALKTKWIEGARELEVIRSKLAESMVYI